MASFVLSPTETAAVQEGRVTPYWLEAVSVEFTTTKEFVASVLPPCFSQGDRPTGVAIISTHRRPDGDGRMLEFDATGIYVDAMYEGTLGRYSLTKLVSGDMAISLGRETLGEINKRGDSRIYSNGRTIYAYGSRKDMRIVEIEAQLGTDLGPSEIAVHSLELKATPIPHNMAKENHRIFHVKPSVIVVHEENHNVVTRKGTGTIKFTDNGFDPVSSIPIISFGEATFTEGTTSARLDRWAQLDTAEELYASYVFGRQYDFPRV